MPVKLNLTGNEYGKLTVLKRAYLKNGRRLQQQSYYCSCACGKETIVRTADLTSGNATSCGCVRRAQLAEGGGTPRKDITGQQYGHWTVLRFVEMRKSRSFWLCLCICGEERPVDSNQLKAGHSNSCGCKGDVARAILQREKGVKQSLLTNRYGHAGK